MANISGEELRLLDDSLFSLEAEMAKGGVPHRTGVVPTLDAFRQELRAGGPMFPDKVSSEDVQRSNDLLGAIFDMITREEQVRGR